MKIKNLKLISVFLMLILICSLCGCKKAPENSFSDSFADTVTSSTKIDTSEYGNEISSGSSSTVSTVTHNSNITQTDSVTSNNNQTDSSLPSSNNTSSSKNEEGNKNNTLNYNFKYKISEEVLCNYLARAVTVSTEGEPLNKYSTPYIKSFILNTGAKYIQRAATCWNPSISDYSTHKAQKEFIDDVHKSDSDVVFEACVFECVSTEVNQIPIPEWVFEDFGLKPEKRNFSFNKMCFTSGLYLNQWGANTAVPDITRTETKMFYYYRACEYINLGFEALHMGQVHLTGSNDTNWKSWTELLKMIRTYAYKNARRNFVFINSHTHGIVGSDGILLFDFHSYPSRPMADGTQSAHKPSENNPQYATFKTGHSDSIYGKSLGGKTYSGWSCTSLPYLVELDNYGDDTANLNIPNADDMRCWGMDEITWFANQPASYRARFLSYAYDWVRYDAEGNGFLALPGERVARYYDQNGNIYSWRYYGYNSASHPEGNNDEETVKKIFSVN